METGGRGGGLSTGSLTGISHFQHNATLDLQSGKASLDMLHLVVPLTLLLTPYLGGYVGGYHAQQQLLLLLPLALEFHALLDAGACSIHCAIVCGVRHDAIVKTGNGCAGQHYNLAKELTEQLNGVSKRTKAKEREIDERGVERETLNNRANWQAANEKATT